jgi:hypothetical protein
VGRVRGEGGGLNEAVETAGKNALQAPANVAVGLALGAASCFVVAGIFMAAEPGDRNGVQGAVEVSVAHRLSRCRVRWPLLASSGATPAREANAASLRTRPRWDQLTRSWAATTGPTPGSASNAGPAGCCGTRTSSSTSSSAAWLIKNRIRAAIERSVRTVTRCSRVAPVGLENRSIRSSCLANPSPLSWARRCSGATTIKLFSSLIALVRLIKMPCRVTSTCRSASRSPRSRGVACSVWASAVRAAWTASIRSFLAPRERLLFWIFHDVFTRLG